MYANILGSVRIVYNYVHLYYVFHVTKHVKLMPRENINNETFTYNILYDF